MNTFWAGNAKRLPKWSKSITFIDKTHTAFRYVKNLIKPTKNKVSRKPKTRCENPYKTCVKLMIFESQSQKGFQNDQKSITFIDKTHMAFRHVEKPYKTCRKWRFQGAKTSKSQKSWILKLISHKGLINPTENEVSQKSKTRCENPYKTCRKWRPFELKSQKGLQNYHKALRL